MAENNANPPHRLPNPVQGIRAPQALSLDNNVSDNWKLFKQKWRNYSIITQLQEQAMPYQVALLLHTLGDEALKVYNGFNFTTAEDQRTVEEVLLKFDTFAVGDVNETYERFLFNKRDQRDGENFESFNAAIRSLVKTCNYCQDCVGSILRDRIVIGINDPATQTALLKERNLTLEMCCDICKAAENAQAQGKLLRPETVNKVGSASARPKKPQKAEFSTKRSTERMCKFCGLSHAMNKKLCPAWGKTCSVCSQRNHFAIKCPQSCSKRTKSMDKHVHQMLEESTDDEEWINCVNVPGHKDIKCHITVGDQDVVFQIDTGSSVNIIPEMYANSLSPTVRKLKMWNGTVLTPLGTCRRSIRNPKNRKKYSVEFVVVKEDFTPLLGLKAAQQMDLVTVNDDNLDRVASLSLLDKHSKVFEGSVGAFPGEHHLMVDESITPVVMPTRRVPIAIRSKLKAELDRLCSLNVITPVDEPTPWVSQLVIVEKKSGALRICLDPRELNKALLREHYTLPVLDECLHELSKSCVFTKVDLSSGYWHVKLDEESSRLTSFQTPFGRYMWRRLPFGTNVSSEIFQRKLHEQLTGLPGLVCLADDVVIHGENAESHDKHLELFLSRCEEKGILLNRDKFDLRMSEITFMGHKITSEGLQTDPEKVRAISNMPAPKNIADLRRFLGMINYLAKFLPNLTDVIKPLQNLTKKDVLWTWSESQENSFNEVKHMVTESPVLAYYNPNKQLILENDASEYGLGSALFQDGKPVAYASRSLTETERRYAQIEKEMLAVSFGLQKFHHYTYGRQVEVITDHKPLVAIVTKPLSKAPKRLQALLLRTQAYNFTLSYQSGKTIPVADTLSRSPLSDKPIIDTVNVNNLTFSPINDSRLNEIRSATEKDSILKTLKSVIVHGWPSDKRTLSPQVATYFSYRDELTVQDGIILRGERVVIPAQLRKDIKLKVHAGHMGINSCLRRARELVFWPGMSQEIRQFIESCNTCATYSDKQSPEPLNLHDVPRRPWEKVGVDIFSISGRSYLVTVDYLSHFFEVDFLQETNSATVITKLKHHFARNGIPDVVITDGGPQFTSCDFADFSSKWHFTHTTSSPGNSKANGAAEAAVKVAKKLMKRSQIAKEDPYLGLLNHRNTPTEGLSSSPAQRLFGRRTKTLLPTTYDRLVPSNTDETDSMENKRAAIANRSIKRRELPILKPGDIVRMQPIQTGEKEWREAIVNKQIKSRTYEVATQDGKRFRRNRQFLRSSTKSRGTGNNQPFHNQNKPTPVSVTDTPSSINQQFESLSESPVETMPSTPYRTRSGRVVKTVDKLNL